VRPDGLALIAADSRSALSLAHQAHCSGYSSATRKPRHRSGYRPKKRGRRHRDQGRPRARQGLDSGRGCARSGIASLGWVIHFPPVVCTKPKRLHPSPSGGPGDSAAMTSPDGVPSARARDCADGGAVRSQWVATRTPCRRPRHLVDVRGHASRKRRLPTFDQWPGR
jgi:hypothetical protein